MKTLTLVIVRWKDARQFTTSTGYTEEECLDLELAEIETVGYLIEEGDIVRVASERRSSDKFSSAKFGDVTIIPTSQVISIRKVRIRSRNDNPQC